MAKNAKVNVLIQNSEWKTPTTQAIGWHPIIEAIPSNSNPTTNHSETSKKNETFSKEL